MKALFCTACFDIRALDPEGEWTGCRCGNMAARWTDPVRGRVAVRAKLQDKARILGLNNRMLEAAASSGSHNDEFWRNVHDVATNAAGYIFDKSCRACWACVVRVGETGDITWDTSPTEPT